MTCSAAVSMHRAFRLHWMLFAALILAPHASAQDYSVVRIPTLGTLTRAWTVNDGGQVVGMSTLVNTNDHAFLWHNRTPIQDLGTFGGYFSTANAINAAGDIVGAAEDPSRYTQPFLWNSTGGMQNLGTLGGPGGGATGINDLGEVVGSSLRAGGLPAHAFLWTKANGMLDLGDLATGATISSAAGINNFGEVVGSSTTLDGFTHAFLWTSSGGMQDLGTLGGQMSYGTGITNDGTVVGSSETADGVTHIFLWTSAAGLQDVVTPPGFLNSICFGVSPDGQVLGLAWSPGSTAGGPFLWSRAKGFVFPGPFGNAKIDQFNAMNRAGKIVGAHYNRVAYSSYVLTPIMHVTIVSSSNPSAVGHPVTITGRVQSAVVGNPPDGEIVRLNEGQKNLGVARLSKGVVTFTLQTLAAGSHALRASYAGDSNYDPGKSGILQLTVVP